MDLFRQSISAIVREVLDSNRWENPDCPGSANIKELQDYLMNPAQYAAFRESELGSFYLAIIEPLEWAFNDEWLPYELIGLPLPRARVFLQCLVQEVDQHGLEAAIPLLRIHYPRLKNEP